MENVTACSDNSPVLTAWPNVEKPQDQDCATDDLPENYLDRFAILVNLLSAMAFTLATAFTSEFVLMTTFWQGIGFGLVAYGLFAIVGGNCGDA